MRECLVSPRTKPVIYVPCSPLCQREPPPYNRHSHRLIQVAGRFVSKLSRQFAEWSSVDWAALLLGCISGFLG
jgi:hypothetical protein